MVVSIARPRKNLPPLAVDTNYIGQDFEGFEYFGAVLTGGKAILRLHLKYKTTIDLPVGDEQLRYLRDVLNAAYPS